MKYFFRKFHMIHYMYIRVKGDKNREKELKLAVLYMICHPSLFLKKKRVHLNYKSVEKNINCIVTAPYIEIAYDLYK